VGSRDRVKKVGDGWRRKMKPFEAFSRLKIRQSWRWRERGEGGMSIIKNSRPWGGGFRGAPDRPKKSQRQKGEERRGEKKKNHLKRLWGVGNSRLKVLKRPKRRRLN